MPTMQEVREKYPQYEDLSDEQLAKGLHQKFYSDIPFDSFAQKIGYSAGKPAQTGDQWAFPNAAGLKQGAKLAARTITELATDIPTMLADIPVHAANALGAELPTFASSRDALLTPAFGQPETNAQNAINVISRGAGGGGIAAGAARLGANAANQTAQRVAASMAARPGLQVASGATGAGSAEAARQRGVGPVGQLAAGLAGGLIPAAVTPRPPFPQTPESLAQRLAAQSARSQAGARATATAEVSPGTAAAENVASVAPEVRIRGALPPEMGPDPSAGLSVPQQRVAAEGRRLGMQLTPGQATGSRALQQLEARLESQPATSGPFNTLKANNARVLQRAAAQSIGESSDTLDDAVLARADDRIGRVFESVADDNARNIDPQEFLGFIGGLQADARGLVRGVGSHPLIEDLIGFAQNGQATGRQLQNLTSKLGKAARMNMTSLNGDRELGLSLYRAKDYVDDLLMQGMSSEQAQIFNQARQQYRNLLLLTQRVNTVNPSNGVVNPRTLASVLQSKDRRGYLFGENQSALYNATRFAQAFQPIVGDSGTATRMGGSLTIPDIIVRIPMSLASRAYLSGPGVRLATGAQAAAQSVADYPAGVMAPFGAPDVPYGGIFAGGSAGQ